jgi:hypothetical protein
MDASRSSRPRSASSRTPTLIRCVRNITRHGSTAS